MTILGLDVSNHQGAINFAAAKSAARDFVVIKATEGVGFTDGYLSVNRKAAHAAGLVVGLYHFARDNTPAAEAAAFASAVGSLQAGEFLVLDQEVPHSIGNVPWCAQWLADIGARYGVRPLVYMNQGNATGVTSGNWSQIAQTYPLWLARYDNAPTVQSGVPYWGTCAMKQYSDAGSVLGVNGPCDVNSYFGTASQLLAYGKGATDMPLTDADATLVAQKVWSWMTSGQGVQAQDRLTGIDAMQLPAIARAVASIPAATVPQVNLDEAKLAAALLADPASVDALGKAIAAHLKLAAG